MLLIVNAAPLEANPSAGRVPGTTTARRATVSWGGVALEVGAEAIVQLEPGAAPGDVLAPLGAEGVRELFPARSLWLVRDARGARNGAELAAALSGAPGVRHAEPDLYLPRVRTSLPVPPDDPRYPGQWYLSKVDIEKVWAHTTGSPDVTIQVVDNGCETAHPDLAAHVLPGYDAVDQDDDPAVEETGPAANHGTACAGVAAAVGNNALGIAGACPECKVRCVRMLGGNGAAVPVSADVDALRFALDHPDVAVVSNSWGFTQAIAVPPALRMAIEDVSRLGHGGKGALVVFAAGNDNRELTAGELYSLPEVLTVGAVNNFDEAAPFSNRGAEVDLTAPTGSLTLDLTGAAGESPDDYTQLFGGTSAACPLVAGVAGLLFSAKPDATAAEVRVALETSPRPAPYAEPDADGHDPLYGRGIVAPEAALNALLGRTTQRAPRAAAALGQAAGCTVAAEGAPAVALVWVALRLRRRPRSSRQHVSP